MGSTFDLYYVIGQAWTAPRLFQEATDRKTALWIAAQFKKQKDYHRVIVQDALNRRIIAAWERSFDEKKWTDCAKWTRPVY